MRGHRLRTEANGRWSGQRRWRRDLDFGDTQWTSHQRHFVNHEFHPVGVLIFELERRESKNQVHDLRGILEFKASAAGEDFFVLRGAQNLEPTGVFATATGQGHQEKQRRIAQGELVCTDFPDDANQTFFARETILNDLVARNQPDAHRHFQHGAWHFPFSYNAKVDGLLSGFTDSKKIYPIFLWLYEEYGRKTGLN